MTDQADLDKLRDSLCRHGNHVGAVTAQAGREPVAIPVCGNPACRARASLYLKTRYTQEPVYKSFKEYGRF